jgi:hypothetical protein
MTAPTEEELTQKPIDNSKGTVLTETEAGSNPEIAVPILEVHPPHEAVHTWRSFFIHIATIVIGLFIAVGIEQTVEVFHHRHVSEQLEGQMREVFASNLVFDALAIRQLGDLREYLLQLRTAISARLDGAAELAAPPASDPRMSTFPRHPSLAPYDAAKENGSVAYLSTARIRLYNRVAYQKELASSVREHWFDGLAAFSAFNERYTDSTENLEMGGTTIAPDLAKLSRPELVEYRIVVAALIKKTDLYAARLRLFDLQCEAILKGVEDEDELVKSIASRLKDLRSPYLTAPQK